MVVRVEILILNRLVHFHQCKESAQYTSDRLRGLCDSITESGGILGLLAKQATVEDTTRGAAFT